MTSSDKDNIIIKAKQAQPREDIKCSHSGSNKSQLNLRNGKENEFENLYIGKIFMFFIQLNHTTFPHGRWGIEFELCPKTKVVG